MALQWEAPGETGRGKARSPRAWAKEAAQLSSRSGEWALLCTKSTPHAAVGLAHRVKSGDLAAFSPAGAFEATVRGCRVYVRHVGADGAS